MPADNRISTLPEISALYSDTDLLSSISIPSGQENSDSDTLFLITKSGVKNEKITFKSLKTSIVGNTVSLTGNQIISGEKTFADICTFQDTVFLNEVIDTSFSGDISGFSFVGQTGSFEKLGVGQSFANKSRNPDYALHVDGDVFIEGQFNALGNIQFGGNLGLNDIVISGDLFANGSGVFASGINVSGDSVFSGSMNNDGNTSVGGNLNVSGDILIDSKIVHTNDPDTYIEFSGEQVSIVAGSGNSITINDEEIDFKINGVSQTSVDSSGRLLVNTSDPLGNLSVSGDSYLEKLYITGSDGSWQRLTPRGYDEAVNFSTNLLSGQTVYEIDFPKTFGSQPLLYSNLQNNTSDPVLFFNAFDVSESSYFVKFNQPLPTNNYSIQTSARTVGDFSLHQTKSQAFKYQVIEGQSSYEVEFNEAFAKPPTISSSLELKISHKVDDPGALGDTFIDGWEYYIAVGTDTWRRITTAESFRSVGSRGDTDFDDDFYYVCIDGSLWGKIPLTISLKSDPGTLGDVEYDNNYIYVFTSAGWKESPIITWPSEEDRIVPYVISDITENSFKINFGSIVTSQYFLHIIASR
jgi:hypothetical protein